LVDQELIIEPFTRIEGHLGIHVVMDPEKRRYTQAHSYLPMFRGFEIILRGREPADAPWFTQRVCGVCPVPHGIASSMAVDMVYNAPPPPMGVIIRNAIFGAEQLYDSPLGCLILQGPDYCQSVVEKHNPEWWKAAQDTKATHVGFHGYNTIADIMTGLNPITGSLWLKGNQIGKLARKMASLLGGKHPHANTYVPGGVALTLTTTTIEQYASMLSQHIAFSKEFIPAMDDLLDFLIEMGYEEAGYRDQNLISYGAYDDPKAYTSNYKDLPNFGEKRLISPGVVLNGELITQDLIEIQLGVRSYVDRSFYEDWSTTNVQQDPLGNPVEQHHPWNKLTHPAPAPFKVWDSKYSWATSIRWKDWKKKKDGADHTTEAGPISRMWVTAMSKKVPESTGTSLKWTMPKATLIGYRNSDEMDFEWKIPEKVNSIERLRARAYYYSYSVYALYNQLVQAMELMKSGNAKVWNRYKKPRDGIGVGMIEAMRGALAHWVIMKNHKIENYQIITPSTWDAGPRRSDNDLGPYEDAIIGTPITETMIDGKFSGIDAVRVVHSYDPCMACDVHMYRGDDKIAFKRITI
jgi:hydrogenase large subunit